MALLDARGVPASAAGPATLAAFEQVLQQYLGFTGDPMGCIDALLADAPAFVLGHCLKTGFLLYQHKRKLGKPIQVQIEKIEQLPMDERERGHLAALKAWAAGDWPGACAHWETLLRAYPRDLLALKLCTDMHFFLGHTQSLRELPARVLPGWTEDTPGYGYVLGVYAFGLEECGDFQRAEDTARQALSINPKDAWAIHAITHVMEMTGRPQEGIAWLRGRESDWVPDNFFAIHLWWHLALYHLRLQDYDAALALYDNAVRWERSTLVLHLVDASALLWRLHLAGVDGGTRTQELADAWEPLAADALYAFNDLHAMLAFVLAGRERAAQALLAAGERAAAGNARNAAVIRAVGLPAYRALHAFGQGDYRRVVELLQPIRYAWYGIGGSHAQREVLALTLAAAAARSPN